MKAKLLAPRRDRRPSPDTVRPVPPTPGQLIRRAWTVLIQHPWILLAVVAFLLIVGSIAAVRATVYWNSYNGHPYTVRQVVFETGFVPWQGEETAVRGRVLGPAYGIPSCGLQAVLLGDTRYNDVPPLIVIFHAQPTWLRVATRLPLISVLLPPGLPSNPRGIWTFKGHLTLDQHESCQDQPDWVLMANALQ